MTELGAVCRGVKMAVDPLRGDRSRSLMQIDDKRSGSPHLPCSALAHLETDSPCYYIR